MRKRTSPKNPAATDGALLDRLYAAVGTADWRPFLDHLAGTYGGGLAAFALHDISAGGGFAAAYSETDPAYDISYAQHYARVNPWQQRAATAPPGATMLTDALIPPAEFKRTEFYNDWCRPQGLDLAIGLIVQKDRSRSLSLNMLLPRATYERDPDAVGRMERLTPHLLRAAQLDRQLREAEHRADAAEAAMAGLAMGLILTDAKARVRFIDATAQAIVAVADGLLLTHGTLRATLPAEGEQLHGLIANAVAGRRDSRVVPGGLMRITRRSGAMAYEILVGPAPQSRLALGDLAVLFIRDPAARPMATGERLRALYRITPAEARLLEALLTGNSLDEIAAQHAVSRETLRSQLRALFRKTGTSSQRELIRLCTGTLAAINPGPRGG